MLWFASTFHVDINNRKNNQKDQSKGGYLKHLTFHREETHWQMF